MRYATDGTRQMACADGSEELVAARAARRHDGAVLGGRTREREGTDNYLLVALVALIDGTRRPKRQTARGCYW